MVAVTVDAQYRITIPEDLRDGLEPGDVLIVEHDVANGVQALRYVKAVNPFDVLTAHALEEYRSGRTLSLDEAFALVDDEDDAAGRAGLGD